MKSDGRLARCPLKGTIGDAIFAVLCGCGHNLRKILAHLRALITAILAVLLGAVRVEINRPNVRAAT
jgi:IS5 family transposase